MDELIREANVQIEPVTADQVSMARMAFRRYGKGRGHPAGLNFGDLFSYAINLTAVPGVAFADYAMLIPTPIITPAQRFQPL